MSKHRANAGKRRDLTDAERAAVSELLAIGAFYCESSNPTVVQMAQVPLMRAQHIFEGEELYFYNNELIWRNLNVVLDGLASKPAESHTKEDPD